MLLCLLWALPFAACAQGNAEELRLVSADQQIILNAAGSYLHDPEARLGLLEVQALPEAWTPPQRAGNSYGFVDGAHWRHLRLRNVDHPDENWLLVVDYPLLDYIDVYLIDSRGQVEERQLGDRRLFAARSVPFRQPNVSVVLPRGESRDIYVRVVTESSVQIPLHLYSPAAFLARTYQEQLILGIYFGLLLGLLLYNLLLFLTLRDWTYLWYVLYLTCFGWVQLGLTGLAYEHLWPRHPAWANVGLLLSMTLGQIAMLQFSRSVLGLRERLPQANRWFQGLMVALALLSLAALLLPYRLVVLLATASVFLVAPSIFGSAIIVWRRGYAPARYFLLAWSFLLMGVVTYALLSFGLVPKNLFTEHGIQLGSAAEMILLAVALAYRINQLTEQNRRMARESAEQLEARVRQRSSELDHALAELSQAHQRLQAFSERDGLTGVHNRRHGDTRLQQLHAQAQVQRRYLSLLLVDVDRFSSINSQFGHLQADDCLREVARTLQSQLGNADELLVRYGGDCFLLVLPECDLDAAAQRAEAAREAVLSARASARGPDTLLTSSTGYITLGPDDTHSIEQLLELAQQALQAAQRAGGNRVLGAHQLGT